MKGGEEEGANGDGEDGAGLVEGVALRAGEVAAGLEAEAYDELLVQPFHATRAPPAAHRPHVPEHRRQVQASLGQPQVVQHVVRPSIQVRVPQPNTRHSNAHF